jgi:hypothetical protein
MLHRRCPGTVIAVMIVTEAIRKLVSCDVQHDTFWSTKKNYIHQQVNYTYNCVKAVCGCYRYRGLSVKRLLSQVMKDDIDVRVILLYAEVHPWRWTVLKSMYHSRRSLPVDVPLRFYELYFGDVLSEYSQGYWAMLTEIFWGAGSFHKQALV